MPHCAPDVYEKNSTSYLQERISENVLRLSQRESLRLLFPIIIFYESFSFSVAFSPSKRTRFKIMNFLTFFLSLSSLFSTIKMSILLTDVLSSKHRIE